MVDFADEIAEIIKDVCTSGALKESDYGRPFNELGIDSLDFSGILLALEEKYEVKISDKEAANLTTVILIAEYLGRNVKK